jgi:hypothetical protein
MKVQTLGRSIALLLFGTLASWTAQADTIQGLTVTITTVNADGTGFSTTLSGGATVNLDSDSPVGAAKSYGVFTIARCSGCAGRARVSISEGSIDKLVFTDAQITNMSSVPQTITVTVSSGPLSVSGPAGTYPYAVELSGLYVAPLGTGSAIDAANQIQVAATATVNRSIPGCEIECPNPNVMIDNPVLDPGETADSTGNPSPNKYSLVAPPFAAAGLAQFATKEQHNIFCSTIPDPNNGDASLCQPALQLSVPISVKGRQAVRLPGSIGAFHVPQRCDPDSNPPLLKGCEIMADFFASLGPKGFKVYDVRLEPSPGIQRNVDFRLGTPNSTDTWVTRRGDDDGDDDDHGNNGVVSNTRVRLSTNGSGDVRASGLCPASGCPSSNVLPVRVYCGRDIIAVTALRLNRRGDGKADLGFSTPCPDPAVLIMDPFDDSWVAAPAIF